MIRCRITSHAGTYSTYCNSPGLNHKKLNVPIIEYSKFVRLPDIRSEINNKCDKVNKTRKVIVTEKTFMPSFLGIFR